MPRAHSFSAFTAMAFIVLLCYGGGERYAPAWLRPEAAALGLADVGWLGEGVRADLLVLESSDWRDAVYALGKSPVREVWIGGERIAG